jgi:hypothetical protein
MRHGASDVEGRRRQRRWLPPITSAMRNNLVTPTAEKDTVTDTNAISCEEWTI